MRAVGNFKVQRFEREAIVSGEFLCETAFKMTSNQKEAEGPVQVLQKKLRDRAMANNGYVMEGRADEAV